MGRVLLSEGTIASADGSNARCSTLSKSLTVQRLPSPLALADIVVEWEALDQQVRPRTPFTTPSWVVPWWHHFRRRRAIFHDEFFCHIVRDHQGRLLAIAPLMRTTFPGFGPPVLRIVQFFGTDPSLTEIRGIICRPLDHENVVKALVMHFRDNRRGWDVFRWNGLQQAPAAYDDLQTRFDFIPRGALPDYLIDLPTSWDELRDRVSSNMRKNLRKAYAFLERDGFGFALRIVERPDDVEIAMRRFLALHAARSMAPDMIGHPNKFARPRERAFLAEYLRLAAERGELRIFELEIGGKIVASRLAFVLGPNLYMYFAGYDPEWKTYSVMTVLICEMIKWALANGIERVNLSTGHDQSKIRWKPTETTFCDAVQVSPTNRAKLAFRAFRAYEALSRLRGDVSL